MTFSTLGTDTTTKQPVTINKTVRPQGLYIVGRQGSGKSGLLENLIIQDIKQGLGVCVIDPHHQGGIIDNIIARLPGREKDVILLDVRDYLFPFGLNLFACSDPTNPLAVQEVVDSVMHVFEKLFGVTHDTPLIWEYLYNCTHTLVVNPGYTMAEIPLLLTDKNCRQKLVANVRKSEVRRFWQRYETLKPDEQEERSAPTLRRVDALLQDVTLHIVGQERSTIDFRAIMDESKILLVKLDSLRLSSVTNLIGSLFIAAFLTTASIRMRKQNIFNIYADEFQNFATEDFVKLIEEARKFGIGITIAHQNRAQLELSNKQAEIELKKRVLNVGSLVVFCVPTDGQELAGQFDITPQAAWEEELEPERIKVLRPQSHERVVEVVDDGVEEIKTSVPDLVYRIVPDAPSMKSKNYGTKKYHPDNQVNEFIEYLTELLRHVRMAKRVDTYASSFTYALFLHVSQFEEIKYVEQLNKLFYEVMKDQNPHKELPLDIFEIMLRDTAPAFFDRDSFENWEMEPDEPYTIPDPHERGKKITFVRALQKKVGGGLFSGYMAPRDYCSSLFIDVIGGYRYKEKPPVGLVEKDLSNWYNRRPRKVPEDLAQAYRLLWIAEDEEHLTVAFQHYEQVLRKVLTEQLRYELPLFLHYHSPFFRFFDPLHVGGALQFPVPADNLRNIYIDQLGVIVKQQILAWINKNGKDFVWQYKSTDGYRQDCFWELTENQEEQFIKRLVAELDIVPEIDHIIATGKPSFEAFIRKIRAGLQAIAQEPITSGSGLSQPRKRTQLHYLTHESEKITIPRKTIMHPQRTYADMLNELANQLVDLPDYMARVKIKGEPEHLIQTLDPKKQADKPLYGQHLDCICYSQREPGDSLLTTEKGARR